MNTYHSWLDIGSGKIITQPMQRVLCEDFVKKIKGKIVFELGEDVEFSSSNLQFRKMVSSKINVTGFIFLGLEQFISNKKLDLDLIKNVIKKKYELHFIRQNLSIKNYKDYKNNLKNLLLFNDLNKK